MARNVYATTEEECEKLLAEMIEKNKAEIAEMKKKAKVKKQHKRGDHERSPLKVCGAESKEKLLLQLQ